MWLIFPILFFGLILLLLAGRVIATPLIYYNRWKTQRRQQKAQRATEEASRRESKRFDDNVGEYVRFEEIKTDNNATATADTGHPMQSETLHHYSEEQISDAVYEEIPD